VVNALDLLEPTATTDNVDGSNGLEIFDDKIDTQIAYAGQVQEGEEINTRSFCVSKDGAGYVIQIGRYGSRSPTAQSSAIRTLIMSAILTGAKDAIASNKKLQDAIAVHSMKCNERGEVLSACTSK
jgi:hypothetical protein